MVRFVLDLRRKPCILTTLPTVPRRFAKWKREAEEWHAKDSAMFEKLLLNVQTEMVSILVDLTVTNSTDPL